MRANYRRAFHRLARQDKLADNVLRETAGAVRLRCGHTTRSQPLAVVGPKALYVCPQGCHDLQQPR